MQYINPFELLNFKKDDLSAIDTRLINKAKRKLLTEIELSDTNSIHHNRFELTKSDCIRAIDDLDDKDKREFHYFILKNPHLNNFLSNGALSFFDNFQVESIYKLPDFLDFVSPFFCEQYDKTLSEKYKKGDFDSVAKILSVKPITNETYFEKCYQRTYSFIRNLDNEIDQIIKDIENNHSHFISYEFSGLATDISSRVNVQLLNLLPTSFFQSLRNQLAHTIRNLARDMNNEPHESYKSAFEIIEIAHSISTDGLAKQTITKGYYTIKRNYQDTIDQQPIFTPQPTSPSATVNAKTNEDEDDQENNQDKIQEKKPEYNSNPYYKIFLIIMIGVFVWGLFNPIVKLFVLSLIFLTYLVSVYSYIRNPANFRNSKHIDKFIFIVTIIACFGGFFYEPVAIFIILYSIPVWGHTLINDIFFKKPYESYLSMIYLIIAVIGTILIFNYNTQLHSGNAKEKQAIIKIPTEKEYFEKGKLYYSQSNYPKAINQYSKAIKLNPTFADAYHNRGVSKANLKQYVDAVSDYLKAEENGYKASILYSNLGFAYYRMKQIDKASINFEKALNIDSTNATAYRWRGEIKYDINDDDGAVADYSLAIKYNPTASNYFARGLGYYYLRDYKSAINDMNKAIELNPKASQYYYDRGDAKEKINDISGACNDWNIAYSKGYSVSKSKLNMCTPKEITMKNGNLVGCNFKPAYASPKLDNYLIIKVENTDVAVKLIKVQTDKCIRFVFINQHTTYRITNIPEGKYYLKIAYGTSWAKTTRESDCQGRFTKNILFKKSDKILDFNLVEINNSWQVPSFELNLNVIVKESNQDDFNRFNTSDILESDFYKE